MKSEQNFKASQLNRYLTRSLMVGLVAAMGLISACGGSDAAVTPSVTPSPTPDIS